MRKSIFHLEVEKLIAIDIHPVLAHVKAECSNGPHSNNYLNFFNNFLFDYGVVDIGNNQIGRTNKYVPFVEYLEKNVFDEDEGITELNMKPQSLNESEKTMARYLVGRLKDVSLEKLKEWNLKKGK